MTKIDILWGATEAASMLFTFTMAPTLLYLLVRKKDPGKRKWLVWLPVSVVLTWAWLVVFSVFAESPALRAYASQHGDYDSDGVGGNAMTLIFGWFIPLLGSLFFAFIYGKLSPNKAVQTTAMTHPPSATPPAPLSDL